MDKDKKEISRRILDVTLEIIYLLTGEDYTIVKKTSAVTPIIHLQESGGWSRSHFPITEPIHEKILELTNKMAELLTGEVMLRDGLVEINPPERCLRPLYFQDCPEENVPEKYQGEDLTIIKVEVEEEKWMIDDQLGMRDEKEEIQVDVTAENPNKIGEGNVMLSVSYKVEDEYFPHQSSGENLINPNVHPGLYRTDLSYNPPNHEEPSADQSQNVTTSASKEGGKRFKCGECGKLFTHSSSLCTHRRIHTGEKPYSCSECGKCFIQKSTLVVHERSHTGEKPYSCSECGKCFTTKSGFKKHERIHTGQKPYSRSANGKCFTDELNLVKHENNQKGEKPFTCSECGKCFISKSGLCRHLKIHTGEMTFSCFQCGKCFTQKANLLTHERIHTGEKPYSCSECGKCFRNKSDLIRHERIHTGEQPYSCSECEKCFKDKSHLIRHKRSHTGEKPFSCPECGKCFRDKSYVVIHQISHK